MRYFHISQGLRGCYMPDSSYMVKVESRRELKAALESEARDIREAFEAGCNKRQIAWLAAAVWRKPESFYPFVAPYGNRSGSAINYCFGLHVSPATRAEFLEYCKAEGVEP